MRSTTKGLMVTAALLALAACSKTPKPADLPPPPPAETAPPAPPPSAPVGSTVVPGSRADFLAQAGSDTVHFATDSYDVDGEAQAILTAQIAWLKKFPNVTATIEGHCDERGTREYNLALGDKRANAAKTFLVNAGIDASRLTVISYGKERPVDTGSDEAAWAQNRRAVTVVPQ
ncbi:peptidoglycan-associated lipoprotein Pal [Sphingomonas sp. AP4-R1]|uniref:peptidoglycan-associated lipoprotein Pal n=1 Tax=Sphingomonas sp. AP4-R1 TaxID=2735134 RepID=UPI00149371F1|nr:peptidoglycan-associated lipoprotein Pal [Sphingomonas sp. AP4-R1]QJU59645.1 peptidoglycan-associated lipoprotein Pal [Sphingomonas sp. AP4-R1]